MKNFIAAFICFFLLALKSYAQVFPVVEVKNNPEIEQFIGKTILDLELSGLYKRQAGSCDGFTIDNLCEYGSVSGLMIVNNVKTNVTFFTYNENYLTNPENNNSWRIKKAYIFNKNFNKFLKDKKYSVSQTICKSSEYNDERLIGVVGKPTPIKNIEYITYIIKTPTFAWTFDYEKFAYVTIDHTKVVCGLEPIH
ncbi:MAG: hypothetical protein QM533_13310 [Cytophagales bacterium]|nr:hypothetical protein [Cytophagales bacterium]